MDNKLVTDTPKKFIGKSCRKLSPNKLDVSPIYQSSKKIRQSLVQTNRRQSVDITFQSTSPPIDNSSYISDQQICTTLPSRDIAFLPTSPHVDNPHSMQVAKKTLLPQKSSFLNDHFASTNAIINQTHSKASFWEAPDDASIAIEVSSKYSIRASPVNMHLERDMWPQAQTKVSLGGSPIVTLFDSSDLSHGGATTEIRHLDINEDDLNIGSKVYVSHGTTSFRATILKSRIVNDIREYRVKFDGKKLKANRWFPHGDVRLIKSNSSKTKTNSDQVQANHYR